MYENTSPCESPPIKNLDANAKEKEKATATAHLTKLQEPISPADALRLRKLPHVAEENHAADQEAQMTCKSLLKVC